MSTVIIIPARMDSKRLPGKPLADIEGVPMVVRVAHQVAMADGHDRAYVATDHSKILATVRDQCLSVEPIMTGLCRSGSDRCAEAASKLDLYPEDIIVNVQGDMPFIPPGLISDLIQFAKESPFPLSTVVRGDPQPTEVRAAVVMDRRMG